MHPQPPSRPQDAVEDFGAVILLLQLRRPQANGWVYVAVPTSKAAAILSLAGRAVDPEAYGRVLLQGEGDAPPAEARELIFERYGFES